MLMAVSVFPPAFVLFRVVHVAAVAVAVFAMATVRVLVDDVVAGVVRDVVACAARVSIVRHLIDSKLCAKSFPLLYLGMHTIK